MMTFLKVILIIAIILLFLLAPIFFFANRNRNSIRENIESGLKELESAYTLTPLDAGDFSTIRLNALMKFDVQQYRIEDLGNLSIMVLDSGVMQMLSFVITPLRKNMPLLSLDYVYLFGTQKGYVEFYDLVPDKNTADYQAILEELQKLKASFDSLKDLSTDTPWYTDYYTVRILKEESDAALMHRLFSDSVAAFVRLSVPLPVLSQEEQAAKCAATREYTDGLLENGGPSTSVFLNSFGKEKTKQFFETVMFGISLYETP